MLMRKFHELMKAQAVNKKNENNGNISTALVDPACIEGDETGNSAPSVLTTTLTLNVNVVNFVNQAGYCWRTFL
ncbi:hypothetical protein Gohar_018262, partial [Gossypium harknessii]|nr:hypothetical protein [Gossypium harknessii]